MSETLKLCPFCGGEGASGFDITYSKGYVRCTACHAHCYAVGVETAIVAWNTRPLEAAARKEGAEKASEWWFDGFVSACAAEKDIPDLLCEIPKHSYNDLLEIHQAATESATKDQGQ